jgi:ATP-binding cassette subfamily B multidrug efflux pump
MSQSVNARQFESINLRVWRDYFPLLRGARLDIILGMFFLVLGTIFLVRASVLLGQICINLGAASFGKKHLDLILAFMGFEVASVLAQYFGRRYLAQGTNQVLLGLRKALFEKLALLPMSYFDAQPLGRIITRVTSDVEGVEGFFAGSLARMATAIVQILIVLISIVSLASGYGLMVILAAIPSLGFSWLTRRPLSFWLRENKSRNAQMNSTLAEFIQGLPVLRVMGLEAWSKEEFAKDTNRHFESSMRVLTWNSFIRPLTVFFSVLPSMTAALVGGFLLSRGELELALIIAVLRLTERFTSPVRVLTQEIQIIQDATASAARVAEMLNCSNEVVNASKGVQFQINGDIEFCNVALKYQGGRETLSEINLKIPAGQKVGIIGQSGAGKSSLINLIPALYRPTSGQILVDGVGLQDWDINKLRSQIGYLSQEPFLFRGSLAANILGVERSNDSVERANFLKLISDLGLHKIFARFPGGFDLQVHDNGANLSGGERQMVAFLRLLADEKRIIILDEATSCLDRAWEDAMQTAILGLLRQRQRTCIVIAHRLETLKACDRLIRLDGGKIVSDELVQY